MADQELITYLRKNLKRFGADALKQKLLDEGIAEAEIEDALTVTLRPESARRRLLPYILFLAVIGIVAIYFAIDQNSTTGPPGSQPPPQSSELSSPETPSSRIFMGHHGYVLQLPPNYRALSDFKDPRQVHEIVYVYPDKTDPTTFSEEGLYGPLGILRLEATPRDTEQGRITIDAVRAGVTASLQRRKALFASRNTQVNGLPGFIVNISAPFPLVQAFIVGEKVLYVLTGGMEQGPFTNVLASIHEVSDENTSSENASANPEGAVTQ